MQSIDINAKSQIMEELRVPIKRCKVARQRSSTEEDEVKRRGYW